MTMTETAAAAAATNEAEESRLVASLRNGDPAAYEQLVREHGGRMLAVARRLLRNEDDSQDAVQEAFLGAFRNLSQFEGQSRLGTWLHRIVVNAALMKLRSKSRRPESSIEELLPRFDGEGLMQSSPSAWRDDLSVALEAKETRAKVHELIGHLPDAYRTVLLLRDIEQMDTLETAKALDLTENAVKTRLHRARQALKAMLDQHFSR